MIHFARKLSASTHRADFDAAKLASLLPHPPRQLTWLDGGYSTINARVITHDGIHAVLRWRSRESADTLTRELAIAQAASSLVSTFSILEHRAHWALVSWLEGSRVDTLLEDDTLSAQWPHITHACGMSAARLHQRRFHCSGFLSASLDVEERLGESGTGLKTSMLAWLEDEALMHRLTSSHRQQLLELLTCSPDWWRQLDEDGARLVHSDFNTKNILAHFAPQDASWHINLLDWEYAFAGSRFIDLGNFLRFEEERPGAAHAFVQGYEQIAGPLPSNWRTLAYLCDLCSMLSMLIRPDLGARTCDTVLDVTSHIIDVLDSGR